MYKVYKVRLRNGFEIKTKDLRRTLEKLFNKIDDVIAVTEEKKFQWVYLDRESFEALKNGEEVTVTTTLTPFASLHGINEAFGYIKLKNIF